MRVIILDETLDVGDRARQVLPTVLARSCASSLSELSSILHPSVPSDVLIANIQGNVSSTGVAECLRRLKFAGRTVALVDDLHHPSTTDLMQCERTTCLVRPQSAADLDWLLEESVRDSFLKQHGEPLAPPGAAYHGIVGRSKQMLEIFSRIEKIAAGDANVCIWGESGTGKELIARAIHTASPRRYRPFVTLDCSAIPEGLMESYLFGHVKGAFTGAVDHREGVFALAHTGTLFIDELCELSLPLQVKLLRVIQSREFVKVGGTKPCRTNIRLVAATNKVPKQEVDEGRFREDLYYRVAVVMMRVPPLRERQEDIPLLVETFIKKFSAIYEKPIRGVEVSAMRRMAALAWPGNVRQLENVIEQAVVLADHDILEENDLFRKDIVSARPAASAALSMELGLPLREVERRYILGTLEAVHGNRTEAARRLGISVRCLQYKLRSYFEPPVRSAAMDALTGAAAEAGTTPWRIR